MAKDTKTSTSTLQDTKLTFSPEMAMEFLAQALADAKVLAKDKVQHRYNAEKDITIVLVRGRLLADEK